MNRNWLAASAATIAVIVVLALGFRSVGGPRTQRLIQADFKRVQTLAALAGEVDRQWASSNHTLPANLDSVTRIATKDPISGMPFEYHPKAGDKFELCASFARDNRKEDTVYPNSFWAHPSGHYCFLLDAPGQVTWPYQ